MYLPALAGGGNFWTGTLRFVEAAALAADAYYFPLLLLRIATCAFDSLLITTYY